MALCKSVYYITLTFVNRSYILYDNNNNNSNNNTKFVQRHIVRMNQRRRYDTAMILFAVFMSYSVVFLFYTIN